MGVDMSLKWRGRADEFLKTLSWDSVWNGMNGLIEKRMQPEAAFSAGSGAPVRGEGVTARV